MATSQPRLHELTDEWLESTRLRGFILFNANATRSPFKYCDAKSIPPALRCENALQIKQMRNQPIGVRFLEDGPNAKYFYFAGVESTVHGMRCLAVTSKLNHITGGTSFKDLCSTFPCCLFQAFEFSPLMEGCISEEDYLGTFSYEDRMKNPDKDYFPSYTRTDRKFMMSYDKVDVFVHRGQVHTSDQGSMSAPTSPTTGSSRSQLLVSPGGKTLTSRPRPFNLLPPQVERKEGNTKLEDEVEDLTQRMKAMESKFSSLERELTTMKAERASQSDEELLIKLQEKLDLIDTAEQERQRNETLRKKAEEARKQGSSSSAKGFTPSTKEKLLSRLGFVGPKAGKSTSYPGGVPGEKSKDTPTTSETGARKKRVPIKFPSPERSRTPASTSRAQELVADWFRKGPQQEAKDTTGQKEQSTSAAGHIPASDFFNEDDFEEVPMLDLEEHEDRPSTSSGFRQGDNKERQQSDSSSDPEVVAVTTAEKPNIKKTMRQRLAEQEQKKAQEQDRMSTDDPQGETPMATRRSARLTKRSRKESDERDESQEREQTTPRKVMRSTSQSTRETKDKACQVNLLRGPDKRNPFVKAQEDFFSRDMPEIKMRLPCLTMEEVQFLSRSNNAKKFLLRVAPLNEKSKKVAMSILMSCILGNQTKLAQNVANSRKDAGREYAIPEELLTTLYDFLQYVYGGRKAWWAKSFRNWKRNVTRPKRISKYFRDNAIKKEHRQHFKIEHLAALAHHYHATVLHDKFDFEVEYPPHWDDYCFWQENMPSAELVTLTLPVAPEGWNERSPDIDPPQPLDDMDEYRESLKAEAAKMEPMSSGRIIIPSIYQPIGQRKKSRSTKASTKESSQDEAVPEESSQSKNTAEMSTQTMDQENEAKEKNETEDTSTSNESNSDSETQEMVSAVVKELANEALNKK